MSEYSELAEAERQRDDLLIALKVERDLNRALNRVLDGLIECLKFYSNENNYNDDGVLLKRGKTPDSPDGPGEYWEEPEFGDYALQTLKVLVDSDI